MIEKKMTIPAGSILKNEDFDYIDSFQGVICSPVKDVDIIEIGNLFLSSGPDWANSLMVVRDSIVGVFGLKTGAQMIKEQDKEKTLNFVPGESVGLFKVFKKTENELIMGEDDAHLDFRISIFIDKHTSDTSKSSLSLTTTVVFKNWFGRLYFLPVQFFHQLIVKATLKRMLRKINWCNDQKND
jgi:hypothetical protein